MQTYLWIPERAGEKLRAVRMQRGLTSYQVAEFLGCTKSIINYYENGQKTPTPLTMAALATLYQVSLEDLFFDLVEKEDTDGIEYEEDENGDEDEADDVEQETT